MKILFLSNWFPYPPDNGSKLRIFQLLRVLAEEHNVTLLSFTDKPDVKPEKELCELCESIHLVHRRIYQPLRMSAIIGLLSCKPRSFVDTYSQEMEKLIRLEISSKTYDLVIASELNMVVYWRVYKGVVSILEDVELGILKAKITHSRSWWKKARHTLSWLKLRTYLRRIPPPEVGIEVIPNFINIHNYQGIEKEIRPNSMIFMGSFRYFANYDAMIWFLTNIFPLIRSKVSEASLIITGDHAELPLPTIENLVPLRVGGGTRLKILESMALRTPIVSTSKGAEGLEVIPGKHLLIADTPEEFADCVLRLMADTAFREQMAESAYDLLQEKYDARSVAPKVRNLIQKASLAYSLERG